MRIYVSGPVAAARQISAMQDELVALGHELTLDWAMDTSFADNYASRPDRSARTATEELAAVLNADAIVVVATEHDGRGMFVELGAALARVARNEPLEIVVVGDIRHESVFYFHPAVQRFATLSEWLQARTQ